MATDEKRIDQRVESSNLLSYICLDENNHEMMQGMGRTLNVSEGGILLETHVLIDPKVTIELAIGLEDELINIKGSIIFTKPGKDDKYQAGIEFLETDTTTTEILKRYIKVFSEQ